MSTTTLCIIVPFVITAVCGFIACLLAKRWDEGNTTFDWSAILIAFGWWVSVSIRVLSPDWFSIWPADAWKMIVLPMLVSVALLSFQARSPCRSTPGLWALVGMIAVGAAALAMPSGEGWEDTLPLHRTWAAAIAISVIGNSWSLDRMSQRGADRWLLLVVLAGLGCAAIVGAASFASLVECCVAAIVATVVLSVFAAWGKLPAPSAIIFPSALFSACMIASGRFFSYAEIPALAYGIALASPSLIAFSDLLVAKQSVVVRIVFAALTASVIVAGLGYRFLVV